MKNYNFGEKKTEFSKKSGEIPVWISPKYEEAKKKAIELLESDTFGKALSEADFWILMNETKSGKMAYTGLIITHNACLKINDIIPSEKRFNPAAVSINEHGYNGSLVFTYCDPAQGIFEVGEVTEKNCKNDYPYAMALKRCFDRVVLKNSQIAYAGIYSDSEADEFANPNEPKEEKKIELATQDQIETLKKVYTGVNLRKLLEKNGVESLDKLSKDKAQKYIDKLKEAGKI